MRLRFRFRTVPFLATVLLVLLGIMLGNWQTRRAAEKTALQARLEQRGNSPPLVLGAAPLDPAAIEFRHVRVTGEFVSAWPVYLDNRPNEGRAGFILLMPFKIEGSRKYVLVERGWLPRGAQHDSVPPVATPAGRIAIEGVVVQRPARVLQLGTPAPLKPGAIVQNLEPAEFATASGLDLQPFVLEQTGPDAARAGGAATGSAADTRAVALVRHWPAPGVDVDRHRGYAFQWYALAAMALLFFVITGFRSASKQAA